MKRGFWISFGIAAFLFAGVQALAQDDEGEAQPEKQKGSELPAARGDAVNGEKLFRIHCAACHGFTGRGDGAAAKHLAVPVINLHDGGLMNRRTPTELAQIIERGAISVKGSRAMPSFKEALSPLERWDIVAYLETLYPKIQDFFPEAGRFTVKKFDMDDTGKSRIKKLLESDLSPAESSLVLITVFKGGSERGEPRNIPYVPAELDNLKKEDKLGYLAFFDIPGPKGSMSVGMAIAPNGTILKLSGTDALGVNAADNRMLKEFEGQGKRGSKPEPFKARTKPANVYAAGVFRGWVRMIEAVYGFERDEKDRTWAD
ncbi:MAG: hypothetical protein GMKNLPBB_01950 [Myxococcota bacterium]|nr:hypothetical protein [Myxococcota bacterium]